MCSEKTVATFHLVFSLTTAIVLYLSLPVALAWDSSKLRNSTIQLTYIYIAYCIYWIVLSLVGLVSLMEKRKQLLDIHSKICPFIISMGICCFIAYLYHLWHEQLDSNDLDSVFRSLILPVLTIIGMSFDIFTSVNVAMARKKMWIEPYSYQLREHIYESNRNINNEEELYEDAVGSSPIDKKR